MTPIICPNPLLKKKEKKEGKSKHPIVCASKKENVKKKSFQTIEQEKLNEHEGENKGGEYSIRGDEGKTRKSSALSLRRDQRKRATPTANVDV